MSSFAPMSHEEKERWRKKQEAWLKKCQEKNEKDPPKNLLHKGARLLWQALWYPQPPWT